MLYSLGERRPRTAGTCYLAPGARIIGDVVLGPDSSVWFGAILRGDADRITIGRGTNIQDNAVLHTDPGAPLWLDDFVTVGHQAMLHGCRVGANSVIGIGSTVLNHARIGADSIVGAHALVPENRSFPDGVLILGTPARVARELSDEERTALSAYARNYIERAELYRTQFTALGERE